MIGGLVAPGNLSSSRGLRRPRSLLSAGPLRWATWAILALVLVGAVVGAAVAFTGGASPNEAPIDVRAAALGNEAFNRAAASCRPAAGLAAGRRAARRPAPDPAAARPPALLLGISASLRFCGGRTQCEEARLARATGVRAVREDLSWAQAEPRPGQYDWAKYDAVVATATEAGLMVLPILDDAPGWAARTPTTVPSAPASYAAFTAAAVARYGPGGAFWRAHRELSPRPIVWYELWNEPYYADHNRDPGVYARLVRAAVTAGRAANPAARFLIEGDTTYETLAGNTGDWIAGMYAAVPDLGRYFDALAVHPYGGNPAVYTPSDASGQPGRIELAHAELVAHGDGAKPLWVTEIGWSTCSGAEGCVSEAQQASYLKEFLRLARTTWSSYVRAVFVYDLRDSASRPDDREAWFGLLAPDLSPKPAWQSLHDAATGSQ
jgi:polysaccharide biosynthesis protein PslG